MYVYRQNGTLNSIYIHIYEMLKPPPKILQYSYSDLRRIYDQIYFYRLDEFFSALSHS